MVYMWHTVHGMLAKNKHVTWDTDMQLLLHPIVWYSYLRFY